MPTAVQLGCCLDAMLQRDSHAPLGYYHIRSLYFDDIRNSAYFDKISGIDERRKYRIRFYGHDDSFILLEKKEKIGNLTRKTAARIDRLTAEQMIAGAFEPTKDAAPLLWEFHALSSVSLLSPVVYVDYDRFPFTYPESNVRITIDTNITAGVKDATLFDLDGCRYPVLPDEAVVLEIKFDEHLPAHLLTLFGNTPMQLQAISKYCMCREMLG